MALKIGSKAPDFKLKGTGESEVHFHNDIKQPCILYFYPKDFTAGCTKEACEFRDDYDYFKELDVVVFGISRDSVRMHEKFKEKYDLPFELLSDTSGNVISAYDAKFPFINMPRRVTYLIDSNKKIIGVYEDLFRAKDHVQKMKKSLDAGST